MRASFVAIALVVACNNHDVPMPATFDTLPVTDANGSSAPLRSHR
jgi:hypothetical protein